MPFCCLKKRSTSRCYSLIWLWGWGVVGIAYLIFSVGGLNAWNATHARTRDPVRRHEKKNTVSVFDTETQAVVDADFNEFSLHSICRALCQSEPYVRMVRSCDGNYIIQRASKQYYSSAKDESFYSLDSLKSLAREHKDCARIAK